MEKPFECVLSRLLQVGMSFQRDYLASGVFAHCLPLLACCGGSYNRQAQAHKLLRVGNILSKTWEGTKMFAAECGVVQHEAVVMVRRSFKHTHAVSKRG